MNGKLIENPLVKAGLSQPGLQFDSKEPLLSQIANFYRRQIQDGILRPGAFLPTCLELGRQLGVTGYTVNRAYELLEREGLVCRRRALGTIVNALPGVRGPKSFASLPLQRSRPLLQPVCLAMRRQADQGLNQSLLPDYINGLMEGFNALKCRFEVAFFEAGQTLLEFVKALVENGQTRGFIGLDMDAATIDYLIARQFPMVALGMDLSQRGVASVVADEVHGYSEAWEFAAALGHRRAAFLAAQGRDAQPRRYRECAAALHLLGLPQELAPPIVAAIADDGDDIWPLIEARFGPFQAGGDWPTLFFTHNDMIAMRLIRVLADHGIQVPGAVSVVGIDDAAVARNFHPALTTLHKPRYAMARAAALLLVDLLARRPGSAGRLQVFPLRLIERETCAAAAALHVSEVSV